MGRTTLVFDGPKAINVAKALGSEVRIAILEMVGETPRTISQLAAELGIAQPAVTNHVRLLERAGLLNTSAGIGERGSTKLCQRTFDEVCLRLAPLPGQFQEERTTLTMPVGGFSRCDIHPTCGLASAQSLIGFVDDPRSFYLPERTQADILWFGWGSIEYEFANPLLRTQTPERLELSAELCAEAPGFDVNYPSDITFSINGKDVGCWTCPGDMGDKRGVLNPSWWTMGTQYGFLKMLTVCADGTFIDGTRVSSIVPNDILSPACPSITVRLAVHSDARHRGGLTIFGKPFGNYDQDLILSLVTRSQ